MSNAVSEAFLRLINIMDDLREKCPWDKKQTIQSLRQLTLEEVYELTDSITDENWKGIKEELGDLLLHIVFYSKIGAEQNQFTLDEMINAICDKLIARHPHVYPSASSGKVKVKNEDDVKKNWENLKLKEGKSSVLSGVPLSLPAMVKAMRLQEKARQVGFEWENKEQVWEKVEEETGELHKAIREKQEDKIEEELGDLIFSLINYARFLRVDAENALEKTNKKFMLRFTEMEQQAFENGKELSQMTLPEMDAIWNSIKQKRDR